VPEEFLDFLADHGVTYTAPPAKKKRAAKAKTRT
jgi:hypothetical protein